MWTDTMCQFHAVENNQAGDGQTHDQQPGLIAFLLKQSYAKLLESDQEHWGPEVPKWEQFDREVFAHPETIGSRIFLSWLNNQIVGFGSYDPRQRPEFGIIGHNCILPEFRGRGFCLYHEGT